MTLLIEDQLFWSELNPDSLVQALAEFDGRRANN
jgi:hypothetical protein